MYGWINNCLEDMVITQYGLSYWEKIKELAGCFVPTGDFILPVHYDDALTYALIDATRQVLSLPSIDAVWEIYGRHFIHFLEANHYSGTLRGQGKTLREWILHINEPHRLLRARYPECTLSEFWCENDSNVYDILAWKNKQKLVENQSIVSDEEIEIMMTEINQTVVSEDNLLLHYYSPRPQGLPYTVVGMCKEAAKVYFNFELEMELIYSEQINSSSSNSSKNNYHISLKHQSSTLASSANKFAFHAVWRMKNVGKSSSTSGKRKSVGTPKVTEMSPKPPITVANTNISTNYSELSMSGCPFHQKASNANTSSVAKEGEMRPPTIHSTPVKETVHNRFSNNYNTTNNPKNSYLPNSASKNSSKNVNNATSNNTNSQKNSNGSRNKLKKPQSFHVQNESGYSMGPESMKRIFPFHIIVNQDMEIVQVGKKLSEFVERHFEAYNKANNLNTGDENVVAGFNSNSLIGVHISDVFSLSVTEKYPWHWAKLTQLSETSVVTLHSVNPEKLPIQLIGEVTILDDDIKQFKKKEKMKRLMHSKIQLHRRHQRDQELYHRKKVISEERKGMPKNNINNKSFHLLHQYGQPPSPGKKSKKDDLKKSHASIVVSNLSDKKDQDYDNYNDENGDKVLSLSSTIASVSSSEWSDSDTDFSDDDVIYNENNKSNSFFSRDSHNSSFVNNVHSCSDMNLSVHSFQSPLQSATKSMYNNVGDVCTNNNNTNKSKISDKITSKKNDPVNKQKKNSVVAALLVNPAVSDLSSLISMGFNIADLPKHSFQRDLLQLEEHLKTEVNNTVKMTQLSKRLEQESLKSKTALKMKRIFVRYVSHEIRTPLNVALLGLKYLEDEILIDNNVNSDNNNAIENEGSHSNQNTDNNNSNINTNNMLAIEAPNNSSNTKSDGNNQDMLVANNNSEGSNSPRTLDENNYSSLNLDLSILQDVLYDVKSSCVMAVEILNDLLLYEKIDDGIFSLTCTPLSLRTFIGESEKLFKMQAKSSNVKFLITGNVFQANLLFSPDNNVNQNTHLLCHSNHLTDNVSPIYNSHMGKDNSLIVHAPSTSRNPSPKHFHSNSSHPHCQDYLFEDQNFANIVLLQADKAKLHQVLRNLFTNAIKFTSENGLIVLSCDILPYNSSTNTNNGNDTSISIPNHCYESRIYSSRVTQHSEATNLSDKFLSETLSTLQNLKRPWDPYNLIFSSENNHLAQFHTVDSEAQEMVKRIQNIPEENITFDGQLQFTQTLKKENNSVPFNNAGSSSSVSSVAVPSNAEQTHASYTGSVAADSPRDSENSASPPVFLRLSITDSGCGISAKDQVSLFHEFIQVKADKLQNGQGSGLGLWIAANIMKMHLGRIGVYSAGEGSGGTTFFMDIPCEILNKHSDNNSNNDHNGNSNNITNVQSHGISTSERHSGLASIAENRVVEQGNDLEEKKGHDANIHPSAMPIVKSSSIAPLTPSTKQQLKAVDTMFDDLPHFHVSHECSSAEITPRRDVIGATFNTSSSSNRLSDPRKSVLTNSPSQSLLRSPNIGTLSYYSMSVDREERDKERAQQRSSAASSSDSLDPTSTSSLDSCNSRHSQLPFPNRSLISETANSPHRTPTNYAAKPQTDKTTEDSDNQTVQKGNKWNISVSIPGRFRSHSQSEALAPSPSSFSHSHSQSPHTQQPFSELQHYHRHHQHHGDCYFDRYNFYYHDHSHSSVHHTPQNHHNSTSSSSSDHNHNNINNSNSNADTSDINVTGSLLPPKLNTQRSHSITLYSPSRYASQLLSRPLVPHHDTPHRHHHHTHGKSSNSSSAKANNTNSDNHRLTHHLSFSPNTVSRSLPPQASHHHHHHSMHKRDNSILMEHLSLTPTPKESLYATLKEENSLLIQHNNEFLRQFYHQNTNNDRHTATLTKYSDTAIALDKSETQSSSVRATVKNNRMKATELLSVSPDRVSFMRRYNSASEYDKTHSSKNEGDDTSSGDTHHHDNNFSDTPHNSNNDNDNKNETDNKIKEEGDNTNKGVSIDLPLTESSVRHDGNTMLIHKDTDYSKTEETVLKTDEVHLSINTSNANNTIVAKDTCVTHPKLTSSRNARLLIVDDAPSNRKMVKRLLQKSFQEIDEAENGFIALTKIQEQLNSSHNTYHMVMMDFMMPVMNGLDATRAIKQLLRDTGHPDILVVGVTGNGLEHDIEAFREAGADDVLLKPLNVAKLQEIFNQFYQLSS